MFKKLQDITNFLFGWIAEAVKTSVLQGEGSKWNFGSYFGLMFEEFLARILLIVQGNPYWSVLPRLVQCYNTTTAKKDFEFILNSAAHASNAQLVRTTRTRLLYGSIPYIPTEKHDLTEQFKNLSILN